MDTTRITDPISDHLPVAGAASLASAVADATTGLADQITGRVSDLDLPDKVGRTRRTVAKAVPWLPLGSTRARRPRRWLIIGLGLAAVVAGVAIWRRRSNDAGADRSADTAARDDWSTHSSNGANPSVDAAVDRETAPTGA